uniref:TORTIFOLIA1/SINE1-2 N-terminal domain-containing protein n=1 Tax=Kalanchoe fedtschenkoi TaxID=63787 RepID=A0A7N1A6I2_KALFE
MAIASSYRQSNSVATRDLKHRVFTCVNKLSDRDTYSAGVSELESIAEKLSHDSLSVFISCIQSTNSSDKSPVRKQCVKLLGVLSEAHGDALSPHLSKMLANLIRRLRDPDTSVRSVCIGVAATMSARITKPPFSAFLKPLSEAIFTEQDQNAQIGAALCLAAAIESSPDPEPSALRKMMPKFERLLKVESYKAKAAVMTLIGSVIDAGCVSSHGAVSSLVPCLVGFLSSEEWAARKAAAEALRKLALADRDLLSEFKGSCMKTFENRRYDKVKAVRETMKQMLDAWKEVPDLSDQDTPPPLSPSSSKENGSGRRFSGPEAIHAKKQLPQRTVRKRGPLKSSDTNRGEATLGKSEKKPWKIELSVPCGPSAGSYKNSFGRKDEISVERSSEKARLLKPETRRGLFTKNSDDKQPRSGVVKSGRVAPYNEIPESTVGVSNKSEGINQSQRDDEDLALIRKQLKQIENQQSSLLDLLNKFIGSSQTGLQTLETRVHGLEVAVNGISRDLAASSKTPLPVATSKPGATPTCCIFPGTDFLSSKFLRKTHVQEPLSRFSRSRVTSPFSSLHFLRSKKRGSKTSQIQRPLFQSNGGGGFIVNPLAQVQTDFIDMLGVSSSNGGSTVVNGGATALPPLLELGNPT